MTRQIYVDNRECEFSYDYISFEQVVNLWNVLHKDENVQILGNPGIDYRVGNDANILFPGERVEVKEGMKFHVSLYHNA